MEQNSTASTATPMKMTTNEENNSKFFCLEGPIAWFVLIVATLLVIAFIMFLIRKYIVQGPQYCQQNRIDGKVVIITGCNTGIGKETALELARRGAKIYMACRDAARCEAARLEIIEKTQNVKVFNRSLDLSSLASVRQFVAQFLSEESHLDILVNNAGIMATPRKLTVDGYEQQFATNHLGHFLLTRLLLERLKESAPSRIVAVSSNAYLFGRINKKDLMSEKNYSAFFGAYSQSKLANILFTRKLSEELKGTGVTVNCLHPGIVRTELGRYNTFLTCCYTFLAFFMKTPKAGAQTTLRLALDPSLEKSSGGYYMDCLHVPLMWWAKDKEMADWLWKESEKLVGLNETTTPPTLETVIVQNL